MQALQWTSLRAASWYVCHSPALGAAHFVRVHEERVCVLWLRFASLSSLQALLEAVGLPYEKLDAVFWKGHVKVGEALVFPYT